MTRDDHRDPIAEPGDAERDPLAQTAADDPDFAQTATNDAVAGETVLPQPGDGPDGPTGGAEREQEPLTDVNDLADADVDLDEDEEGAS